MNWQRNKKVASSHSGRSSKVCAPSLGYRQGGVVAGLASIDLKELQPLDDDTIGERWSVTNVERSERVRKGKKKKRKTRTNSA